MPTIFVERLWRTVKYTVKCEEVYLKDYANAREARRELRACFRFYNYQRPHQALACRTPAEAFQMPGDHGDERCTPGRVRSPDTARVSLAGAAVLSLISTSILSE